VNRVFVDTSALLALMNAEDHLHGRAVEAANALRSTGAGLVTTSYVMVETYALLDRRLGRESVRRFRAEFEPLLEVIWIRKEEHEEGLDRLLGARRRVSLVDAVSFAVSRRQGIQRAFAYDDDFKTEGFDLA
jgi:predicted nucleic acid-binding protein